MIDIIVGLIFTYLLLSLLATTVNSLITTVRNWKAYYLEKGLEKLLEPGEDKDSLYSDFVNNPLFKQLSKSSTWYRVSAGPSKLSSSNFLDILFAVANKKGVVVEKVDDFIEQIPEGSELRQILTQMKNQGITDVEAYKKRLKLWYDEMTMRASGWYTRHMKLVTFIVGFAIAGILNADTFMMYKNLASDADARLELVSLATNYVNSHDAAPTNSVMDSVATTAAGSQVQVDTLKAQISSLLREDLETIKNPLGLGWGHDDMEENYQADSFSVWLQRIFGWIITAIAISLGAPFWFDLLKKILQVRETVSSRNNEEES